jgi:hypothetical protein
MYEKDWICEEQNISVEIVNRYESTYAGNKDSFSFEKILELGRSSSG